MLHAVEGGAYASILKGTISTLVPTLIALERCILQYKLMYQTFFKSPINVPYLSCICAIKMVEYVTNKRTFDNDVLD